MTGIQIHNWSTDLTPEGEPSMEFVAPTKMYVVINGTKIDLDLTKVPTLSPRALKLLAAVSVGESVDAAAIAQSTGSTLKEIPLPYLIKQLGGASMA